MGVQHTFAVGSDTSESDNDGDDKDQEERTVATMVCNERIRGDQGNERETGGSNA